jgi:hypothetical protein
MDMDLAGAQNASQQNSVAFPSEQDGHDSPSSEQRNKEPKRTLSDLLKIYAEKGTDVTMNPEEAARVADVLKAWINSGSSPYEGEDDFFLRASDDSVLGRGRSSGLSAFDASGRPRGHSESAIGANTHS